MPYYERDAKAIAKLHSELAAIGLPLVRVRKLNAIMNAIEMQVEDEFADREVVDALFAVLLLAAESLGTPTVHVFMKHVEECRADTAKRLSLRTVGGR